MYFTAIEAESSDTVNAALYGAPMQAAVDWVKSSFYQGWDNLTDTGKQWLQDAAVVVEERASDERLRKLRALSRRVQHMWDVDNVHTITDIGGLQHAQPIMQRWIMACPEIRTAYHAQTLDGYSDTYKDWEPGRIGEDQIDYRRAVDGIFIDQGDGELAATSYWDSFSDDVGDVQLDLEEQASIQMTWELAREVLLRGKEDPTSRFNNRL